MTRKGIILAGGKGTRLLPATRITNKHLIPILNRPMIEYPIETLIELGVHDIMIVSGGNHIGAFAEYLGDGSSYDVSFTYKVQQDAGGIAHALKLAEDFAAGHPIAVILGDNIFSVDDWNMRIGKEEAPFDQNGSFVMGPPPDDVATLLVKNVSNASRFGVLLGDNFIKGHPSRFRIVEKPKDITLGDAVVGLYLYPPEVFDIIKTLHPSVRGELEITDVNNAFLKNGAARICYLNDKDFWSDAGTPESLATVTEWALKRLVP